MFTIEAEFVSLADGMVTLRGKDGRTIEVPLNRLNKESQGYVRSATTSN
jgi:hypothetical protein